jgi:hypothetical protein
MEGYGSLTLVSRRSFARPESVSGASRKGRSRETDTPDFVIRTLGYKLVLVGLSLIVMITELGGLCTIIAARKDQEPPIPRRVLAVCLHPGLLLQALSTFS